MNTVAYYILCGLTGFAVGQVTGFHCWDSWQWWAISMPIIVVLTVIKEVNQ